MQSLSMDVVEESPHDTLVREWTSYGKWKRLLYVCLIVFFVTHWIGLVLGATLLSGNLRWGTIAVGIFTMSMDLVGLFLLWLMHVLGLLIYVQLYTAVWVLSATLALGYLTKYGWDLHNLAWLATTFVVLILQLVYMVLLIIFRKRCQRRLEKVRKYCKVQMQGSSGEEVDSDLEASGATF